MAKHKDGFEDILEERRTNSDWKFSLKTKQCVPVYKYCRQRTPQKIKEDVLNSDRVRYRVEMVRAIVFSCCIHLKFVNSVKHKF